MTSSEGNQHLCIHLWIEQQVAATPEAIALIYQDQHYSYQQLNAQANQLARYLQQKGVRSETLVGVCMARSPQMVIALIAVLKAGGAYVPIDPDYPQERIDLIVAEAQVPVLIADSVRTKNLFNTITDVVCIETDGDIIGQQTDENLDVLLDAQLAYVIYTSGSTGKPKGVMIEHPALINFVQSVGATYQLSPADRVLQFASISFDISVEEIFATLTHGATLVLRSPEMLRSTSAFLQTCQRWEISVIDLPTAFWHKLCADLADAEFPDALRLVIIGGERAVPQWLNLWKQHAPPHVRLVNTYGPTEATVVTTLCDLAGPYAVETHKNRILPIGKPLNNVQVYVLDEQRQPVLAGLIGELYIGGKGLARGYFNRPELTAESYPCISVQDKGSIRLYKTGDRVQQRDDGHLEFLGRADKQEKIRGFRIELSEIETVLEQHAKVRQAIVLAREDIPGDKRLVAYVVLNEKIRSEQTLPQLISGEIPSLRAHIQGKLPGYMVPAAFMLLDTLPLSANGKVDKRALPAPTLERPALAEAYVAPRTPLEAELAALWAKVTGVVKVGVNDNFFELGGNSLQTMELISYVEKNHSLSIPLKDFLAMPSVASMAMLVGQTKTDRHRLSEHMSLPQLQQEAADCWTAVNCWQRQAIADRSTAPNGIFMTGATGFLGAFLLQALLQQSATAKIYCLIRAHNAVEAQQKLRTSLEKYLPPAEIAYDRIVPVMGDLTRPLLGMDEAQFQLIAQSVSAIYHSGANVNMFYPYTALKGANVGGTQSVIQLATTGRFKVLHHISTLDVFESLARMGTDVFYENDSIAQGDGISGGYAQSKWIAEKLVMKAAAKGLPVCLYRPGMVTGHSQQGDSNTNDVLCRFIKSLIQLQAAPDLAMRVDMTPVDYVSKAIARLSYQPEAIGKVFHIVNPQPIDLKELVATLQARGYAIAPTNYSDWLNQLYTQPNELSTLAAFTAKASPEEQQTCLELWLGGHYVFDCANTERGLKGELIKCPPADRQLLSTYLNYFVQKGFIPKAAARHSQLIHTPHAL